MDSIERSNIIVANPHPLYNYFHHAGTITMKSFSDRTMDNIDAAKYCLSIVKEKYPKAISAANFRYDWSCLYVIDRILISSNWKRIGYLNQLRSEITNHLFRIIRFPKFTKKRKLGVLALILSPKLYRGMLIKMNQRKIYN